MLIGQPGPPELKGRPTNGCRRTISGSTPGCRQHQPTHNAAMTQRPVRRTGVTLIELLIVLVIVGILGSIAWPSFVDAMNRGRRADAFSALATLTQAQERWRANNPSYQQDLNALPGAMLVSKGGHYDLSVVSNSATQTGYRARASARSGSPQNADNPCQMLEVEIAIGQIIYRSYAAGASDANSNPDPCWVR